MKSIDILLATYNGAANIESQILSILAQTYKHWRLIVHDDGSDDDSMQILKKYEKFDKRITIIDDGVQCGGAAHNFIYLLKFSNSDLIVFCDQDDIWLENKLFYLSEGFSSTPDEPLAIFCNGYAYTGDRGIISNRITHVYPKDLKEQLFLNAGIQGCSLMFNKSLKDKLFKIPNYIQMHDHFITLGALCFGKLEYVDKSLMLYRQFHKNKATANIEYSIKKRIKSIFISDIPVVDRGHRTATLAFFRSYEKELSSKQIRLFKAYLAYTEGSLLERLRIVCKHEFKIYNSVILLLLKTITRKPINS